MRKEYWWILLIVPFLVYLHGLAPSTLPGDTGDFQTSGAVWGVSHPPGYPLYTMMVGVMERLPIPPVWVSTNEVSVPAWRSNLLSAIIGLAALAVLFALVRRLTGNAIAGVVASGALAFSRTFWWHSEMAENDALTALFLLSMLYLSVKWVQDRKPRDAYFLALVSGLGVAHHQSLLLFAPAILVYLGISRALKFDANQWAILTLVFILGFAPFVYLPMTRYRDVYGPLRFVSQEEYDRSDAGEVSRLSTTPPLTYFVNYVGRTVYGKMRQYTNTEQALGADKTTSGDVFVFYALTADRDFSIVFVLLGLVGLIVGRRKTGFGGWFLLVVGYAIYFLVIHLVPSGDVLHAPRYSLETAAPALMLPLHVIWAGFIGFGYGALRGLISTSNRKNFIETALIVIMVGTVVGNYFFNRPYADKSHDTLMHEYCLNALNSCPPNSCLVVAGDEIYPFWYMRFVHPDPSDGLPGIRRDVKLVDWSSEVESFAQLADMGGAMASGVARAIAENPGREVDTTFFNSRFLETTELRGYRIARRGMLFAFIPPGAETGLVETSDQLREKSGVALYQKDLPKEYDWNYWGNVWWESLKLPEHGQWLWPPEADIQWRTGEMLLFYGADAMLKNEPWVASSYFKQWVMVEPENKDARKYLEESTSRLGRD